MDKLLTFQEVSEILSLSVREVYRIIARGELPQPVKIGTASRLCQSDVQEYLEGLKKQRG